MSERLGYENATVHWPLYSSEYYELAESSHLGPHLDPFAVSLARHWARGDT